MKSVGKKTILRARKPSLFLRVVGIVEEARQKVATVANIAQVYTNYEIGRQIVEDEQSGKRRADYGKQVLIDLSSRLTSRFGRGWSVDNLQRMREFYFVYSNQKIYATPLRKFDACPTFTLSWSHYLLLIRIADPVERAFYEHEATQGNWSFRQLERMYRASTFERMEVSKDKEKVRSLMNRPAPDTEVAGEALKDPVVTEFLGIPDRYDESELEARIIVHLQDFMLEMGKGFTFYGRQVRCVIGNHSYYADLAFYNRFTRSFFLKGVEKQSEIRRPYKRPECCRLRSQRQPEKESNHAEDQILLLHGPLQPPGTRHLRHSLLVQDKRGHLSQGHQRDRDGKERQEPYAEDEQEKISELKAYANKNARPPRAFFCPAADLRSLTFSQLCAKMAAFSLKMRNCHEQKTA